MIVLTSRLRKNADAGRRLVRDRMPCEALRGESGEDVGPAIKLEGNPIPESLGATDAVTQAAILSLYDPERSTTPCRRAGADWALFERSGECVCRKSNGVRAGLVLLTEPTTSPTQLRELHALLGRVA